MPAGKVKNIIIMILAAANCLLLILVIPSRLEASRRAQRSSAQLAALFAEDNVTLRQEDIPETKTAYAMELPCGTADALPGIRALLGEQLLTRENVYHTEYTSENGICRIDGTAYTVTIDKGPAEAELPTLTERMGGPWTELRRETAEDGSTVYRCARCFSELPLLDGDTVFTCRNGALEEVSGRLLPTSAAPIRTGNKAGCSAQDALMAFWNSRMRLGWVGSEIRALRQGFLIAETDTPARVQLRPAWELSTDTGTFFVDGLSRSVTAEAEKITNF